MKAFAFWLCTALCPLGAATITFSDANFQAGNYGAPTLYSNGSTTNNVSYAAGQVNWAATLPGGSNAGFSLLRPGFSCNRAVDGAVVSIAASVSMSVDSDIATTAPLWRLFVVRGGDLYRWLISGLVATGFRTVGTGGPSAKDFTRIEANGLVSSGNPDLTQAFSFGFETQYNASADTTLNLAFSSSNIDVTNENASPVPEPASVGVVLGALAALVFFALWGRCRLLGTWRKLLFA